MAPSKSIQSVRFFTMVERRVTFSGDCGQVTAPAFTDTVVTSILVWSSRMSNSTDPKSEATYSPGRKESRTCTTA